MGHNSPAYIPYRRGNLKLCFGDREAFYGDPDFAAVPIDGLLSKGIRRRTRPSSLIPRAHILRSRSRATRGNTPASAARLLPK